MSKPKLEGNQGNVNRAYRMHVVAAIARGWEPLPKSDWLKFTAGPCKYDGNGNCKPNCVNVKGYNRKSAYPEPFYYFGIDRVDNSKGYTLDNCVPCCAAHNIMKGTHSHNDFIKLCRAVVAAFTEIAH
jgi:hypothetical protein